MMNLVRSCDVGVNDMRRRQRSTGELISSVAFFGAALWLFFEARNLLDMDQNIKAVLVYLGAFFYAFSVYAVHYSKFGSEGC